MIATFSFTTFIIFAHDVSLAIGQPHSPSTIGDGKGAAVDLLGVWRRRYGLWQGQ